MNLYELFKRSRSGNKPGAHMTWAKGSASRAASRAGAFLKKELWVWPVIAIVVLSIVGFTTRSAIESTMKHNLSSQLRTLLNVETAMLETWFHVQESNAESLANDAHVRETVYSLIAANDEPAPTVPAPGANDLHRTLQKELSPALSSYDYVGYFVADKSKRIIASSYESLISQRDIPEYDGFLTQALDGETVVSPPFPSVSLLKTETGQLRSGIPTMFVCAPVRDASFQVVGALALRIRPDQEFTRILQLGRIGDTGETYAFNKSGVMVSNSRFDESLILLGLIPDTEESKSILNVLVRDPGGNMAEGYRPSVRRAQLSLTHAAADAIAGNTGVDVDGYRNYCGVPTFGAWTWLPKYHLGLATEINQAEAFWPLTILKWTFWSIYSLLVLGAIAIFVFTVVVSRLQRKAREAVVEAQQLGQYTLEDKIGAGAMGVVYRGQHAMLRRPTAIKLLNVDNVTEDSIQRFEREVRITCQLNHPNTIAIYDFGRTPENIFYYAMEFLDGIDLQTLVDEYGPQPEHRIIHILQQMCGSLYEAHSNGLVHRDIKPANIMLTRRGCQPDFVKVLDFGLVKAVDDKKQMGLTTAGTLTGTPLYMSPESIESPMSVDARSDIYAVGAVGYFLLTGEPVFSAGSIVELCQRHVDAAPIPPSERVGKDVSPELENAILACLDKSRARRPQTARDLAQLLDKSPAARLWNLDEADAWWSRHERGQRGPATAAPASSIDLGAVPYGKTVIGDTV